MDERKYQITLVEDLLGTLPKSKELFSKYVALAFKAWNYFRQGKEVAHLRWSRGQNEAFPNPV